MFAIVGTVPEAANSAPRQPVALRWSLAEDAPPALFADERTLERHVGTGAYQGLEFLHVNARSIINAVPAASRMPFRHTINVYRGCSHACTYCFARPTHTYLGLDTGSDFDSKIVVKVNAVERLRAELRAPTWAGEPIAMGTNTDPYQRAEGKYHLTQGVIRVLAEHGNPFSILTKSTLVLRDLRLLVDAATRCRVRLDFSIGTVDRQVWRLTEPGTPPPDKRVEAVRRLNDAGIPCGVLVAPVIPGLSDGDEQVREVVEACLGAGAVSVSAVALHLRPGVREHYFRWLESNRPDLVSLHRRRFGARAYQARTEQERLSKLVHDTVRAVRGTDETGHGERYRGVVELPVPPPTTPPPVDRQLRLL